MEVESAVLAFADRRQLSKFKYSCRQIGCSFLSNLGRIYNPKKSMKLFIKWFKPRTHPSFRLTEERRDDFVEQLEGYILSCKESAKYSNQRFDYLVIVLSSAAIIFIANLLKFFHEQKIVLFLDYPLYAIGAFGLGIVLNFVSQYISLRSHLGEIHLTQKKVSDLRAERTFREALYARRQRILDRLDFTVILMNIVCLILLLVGAILIFLFCQEGLKGLSASSLP